MNKLLLGMLLVAVSTSALAEWVEVGKSDMVTAYVSSTSIKKKGSKVKMWHMQDYLNENYTSDGQAYLSTKQQSEFDCSAEKVKRISFVWYSGKMGEGNSIIIDNEQGKWVPVVPGSQGEVLLNIACRKK